MTSTVMTTYEDKEVDPWEILTHEAKLKVFDEFQEYVKRFMNDGYDYKIDAKWQSFSRILPKHKKE